MGLLPAITDKEARPLFRSNRPGVAAIGALATVALAACGTGSQPSAGGSQRPETFAAAPTTLVPSTSGPKTPAPDKAPGPEAPGDGTTTTTAATSTTSTTTAAAPTAVAPLATVDIGATGPVPAIGPGIDPPTAIANLQMEGMPIAVGSSVAEYSVRILGGYGLEDPTHSRTQSILMAATSSTDPATILASFRATIEALGTYDYTESTASSDGVNHVGFNATPSDVGAGLPDYEIVVSTYDDEPGLVGVQVDRSSYSEEGAAPPPPPFTTEAFAAPQSLAAEKGWTTSGWSYLDGFDEFADGSPYTSISLDFSAGAGVEADVAVIAADLVSRFGEPDYRDDESDYVYLSYDDVTWTVSWSEFSEGDELSVTWQQAS